MIYRHPQSNIWQYDFTLDGRRYRQSTGKIDKAEAAQIESAARQAARAGREPEPRRRLTAYGRG